MAIKGFVSRVVHEDPEAAIFSVADYGVVADLFEAIPSLTKKLKELNVKIILNKKPSYRISGNSNQDLMILSTKSALHEVSKYIFFC